LEKLRVSEEAIERESPAMASLCYGLTTETRDGRSVLESINDFTKILQYAGIQRRSLFEWNLYFSKWICGPLGYKHPGDVARRLLDAPYTPRDEAAD
jgi:hypothetical protein